MRRSSLHAVLTEVEPTHQGEATTARIMSAFWSSSRSQCASRVAAIAPVIDLASRRAAQSAAR